VSWCHSTVINININIISNIIINIGGGEGISSCT